MTCMFFHVWRSDHLIFRLIFDKRILNDQKYDFPKDSANPVRTARLSENRPSPVKTPSLSDIHGFGLSCSDTQPYTSALPAQYNFGCCDELTAQK